MDSSNTSSPLTIALIGRTALLIKCASILLERGHRITCICSDDNKIIEWALAHHICHTRTVNKFYQVLAPAPPQYILSIVNPIILRQPILSIPSMGAINYHDSLLPRYAGSHATMWAIANGETLHGITWHQMAAKVDKGEILLQKKITIAPNDTVSSLNLKCFRCAVKSFAELLLLLEKKQIQGPNVSVKPLQFFYSYSRPTPACLVDFHQPAAKIKQLFRALAYKHVDNIVGVPRILLANGTIITGRSASIVLTTSNNTPGLIEKFSADTVQVSTKSNSIQINDCHTLLGEKLTQEQILSITESKSSLMPSIIDVNVAQLSMLHRVFVKYEKFWVKRIQKSRSHRLSFLKDSTQTKTYALLAQFEPDKAHYQDIINHVSIDDHTILEMIVIVFLLRINDYYPFTVAVQRDTQNPSSYLQSLFSNYLPININFYSGLPFLKLVYYYSSIKSYLKKRQTYYDDVFIRYMALKDKFPFSTVAIIHGDSLPTNALSKKFKIIFLMTSHHNIHIYANVSASADERYIKRMPMYLSELVKNLSYQLAKPIRSLNIVPKREREWQQQKVFKRTVLDEECLCSKVIDQIKRLRSRHALRVDDKLFTYEQLYHRIQQIACYLNHTFAHDQYQTVAILLPLSLDLVASMFAASCALGKTFVLINPKHPMTYNKRIITTANADIVIANAKYIHEYKFLDRNKIMDIKAVDKKGKIAQYPMVTHKRCVDPYIVFTSGSTGSPKGVRITALGFKNIVLAYTRRYYSANNQNRVACLTQHTFDAFILEVFACLFSGGILNLVSNRIRYDPMLLSNYLSLYSIDMLVLTPSLLRLIPRAQSFQKLKTIICGGEKCEQALVQQWANHRIFINAYGPAENTICTSMYRCKVEDESPFIGKPMPNISTYVLDKYQQLLPIGNAGELYIGGVGLASEYVNNLEETKRLFPYLMIDSTSQRYYKTGDFVKLHLNGQLEYLYRQDDQFKIRGYRIELGEIEKVIASHQSVAASRVMMSQSKDNNHEMSLIALIVKKDAQENDAHINVLLNEYLANQLPHYMRPGRYIFLKKLPLSLHDKVNQLQLEQIVKRLPRKAKQSLTHVSTKEKLIVSIFNSLFKKNIDSLTADFFALGGDSMTAMTLISILKSQGYTLSLNDVFKFSTIQALAKRLTPHRLSELNTTHLKQRNHILLSPIQRWFFKQGFTYPNQWSQACFITLKKYERFNTIKKIVNRLFHKHDVFRLCFDTIGYANLSTETPAITILFHQTHGLEKNWRKKMTHTLHKAHRLINIRQGPLLIGVAAGKSKDNITNLVLICHHLVIDAVSWNVIIGDLNCDIKRSQTPPKVFHEHTFIDWMLHSNTFPIGCYCSVRYESNNHNIPMDFNKGDRQYAQISDIKLLLTEKETAELLYLSHYIFKVKVHTLLLYVLSKSIDKIYRLSRITIDLELHGRDVTNFSMPLDEVIGWFTSIIPVNIAFHEEKLTDEDRIATLATNIRNTKLQYPYVDLTVHSNIALNYWGNWDFGFERKNDIFVLDHIEILSAQQNKAPYPLSIEAYIKQKRLHLIFSYSRHHFAKETIRILSKRWRASLVQLIKKYTPSKASFSQPLRYLPDKQYFQLSSLQKGLLYIGSMLQKQDPYAVQVSIELSGLIDVNHIKHALKRLMYTYPFLCVSIDNRQSEPMFTIAPSVRLPFKLINLSHLSDEQARQQFKKQKNADRCQSISLKQSPLVRFILIKFSEKRACLIFTAHHIIMDGWSLTFLMKTFLSLDENKNTILIPEANDLRIHQYYLQWLMKQQQNTQVIQFWKHYLNNFSTPTLSTLIAKEKTKEMKQVNISRWIDQARMKKITDFIQSYKITLSTFLHAIFSIVLYRYTQTNDVLFGTTVTHRQAPIQGIRESVGFYFNTVPFRYQFNASDTFSMVLNTIKTSYQQVIEYGVVDLHVLRSYTQLSEGSELFDAMFIFEQHTKISEINKSSGQHALKIKSYKIDNPTHYPLSLTVLALDQVQLTLTQDIIKLNTIEGDTFLDSFIHTIDACIHDADNKIIQYSLLSKEKIVQQCVQWNDTTVRLKDITIMDLIDQVALTNPDRVAIQYQEESITYRELIKKSNNLAHYLLEQSINKQIPIALYMERNIYLIVFILGILKSGHAFVPFDSDTPMLRVLDSLKHSQITDLYIAQKYYDKYQEALRKQYSLTVRSLPLDIPSITPHQPLPKVRSKQLAYVLFTSGSTGQPKGVCIKHMSLVNLLQGMQTILSITKNDRLLAFTPITFDISLLEIFLPLTSGATCILTETIKQQGIFSLLSVIKNTPITLMQTTPSTWSFLVEAGWRGNRTLTLICGGDTLLMPLAKNLLKRCKRLFHVYGPTETTIWSTCTQITQKTLRKQGIEIGKPIQNNYVFVLDQHGNLLPVGCKGKLYIGGCSVAAGYCDKKLTGTAFKPIQISREMVQIKQEHASKLYYLDKLYYTGDIVQWNKSTNLTFTGRTDSQVKVRGFRVDLTEIEHVLLKTLSIKQAVVLLRTFPDQYKKLVAYYVADKSVTMPVLKKQISSYLPYYMVPSNFVHLYKFPLTKHGKIDKQKLLSHQGSKPVDCQLKHTHFTNFQQKVARIWKEVLSRTLIQPTDDFFSCGGHSLLVLKLMVEIDQKLGIKMPLNLIIKYPQFIDFCTALEKYKSKQPLLTTQKVINFCGKKIPDPLIKLAQGHSKRPLFLFHPIGGTVFWYIKFASRLKKLGISSIYAFQDPGILSKRLIFTRFDEMAKCYSKIITTIQPRGPYYLAGASSGANMAVTVANMLYGQHQSIAFVGLFDGWAKYPRELLQSNIFHAIMESQYSTLKEKFKRMGIDSMDALFRIQMQRQQLLFDHKQTSIPFKINLYKSTTIAPIFKTINEKSNYWEYYCNNELIIHNVPGDHETMFSDENARELAKIVFGDMSK